jgi:uncharacterized protein
MKKFRFLLVPLLALVSSCRGQEKLPDEPGGRTLLWEVSGNGLAKPSYFLGTMHILCAQDAAISPQVQMVMDRVGEIYFEVDLDDMVQLFGSLKAMAMKDGVKLSDLLSTEDYEKVKTYFSDKLPLPFSMLEAYKPLLLSSMIAEEQMPCESTNGMEILIMGEASKRGLDIKGLETMEYQAGLFDSIPYSVQARELVKAIDSLAVDNDAITQLLKVYREQDLEGIERLTIEEEGEIQENIDLLLYGRNRNWAAMFGEIAKKGPVLFAVGAGHLPGQQGVLQLLKKQGYLVRPIKNEMTGIKKMSL